jgi:hypothetical protein
MTRETSDKVSKEKHDLILSDASSNDAKLWSLSENHAESELR